MTTKFKNDAVDPRVRMKEVRSEVTMYVGSKKSNPAGLSHLGELPKNMPDARRVIIALQDLLEESNVRHKKASDHVRDLKYGQHLLLDGFNTYLADAHNMAKDYQERMSLFESRYESLCEKSKLKTEFIITVVNQVNNLKKELAAMTKERDTWRATASLVIKESQ